MMWKKRDRQRDVREAERLIHENRMVPNFDATEFTTVRDIVEVSQEFRSKFGDRFRVVEILDRNQNGVALEAMGPLYQAGFLPFLGTGLLEKQVRNALRGGAVGYVSPAHNPGPLRATLRQGAIAMSGAGGPDAVLEAVITKLETLGVNYHSQLPSQHNFLKLFPVSNDTHPLKPDEHDPEKLNATADCTFGIIDNDTKATQWNLRLIYTSVLSPEAGFQLLRAHLLRGKEVWTGLSPKFSIPAKAFPWFEAVVAAAREDTPLRRELLQQLMDARRNIGDVVRLQYLQTKTPQHIQQGLEGRRGR